MFGGLCLQLGRRAFFSTFLLWISVSWNLNRWFKEDTNLWPWKDGSIVYGLLWMIHEKWQIAQTILRPFYHDANHLMSRKWSFLSLVFFFFVFSLTEHTSTLRVWSVNHIALLTVELFHRHWSVAMKCIQTKRSPLITFGNTPKLLTRERSKHT